MKYRQFYNLFLLLSILITLNKCTTSKSSSTSSQQREESHQEETYAVRNVTIITMTAENKIIENAKVVITDRKILSINKPVPTKTKIIDRKGKWLIPGLIDMHVHNLADINFGSTYPTKGAISVYEAQQFVESKTLPYLNNGQHPTITELNNRVKGVKYTIAVLQLLYTFYLSMDKKTL